MNPRQTDIPHVEPGDSLSQSLINQVINAANNNRLVSGEGIDATQIGNMLGLKPSGIRPNSDADILVRVKGIGNQKIAQTDAPVVTFSSTYASWQLQGGLYYGSAYLQPFIKAHPTETSRGIGTSCLQPIPLPNAIDCVILNLAEMDTRTDPITAANVSLSTNGGTNLIMQDIVAVGRQVGVYGSGIPLIAVNIPVYVPVTFTISGTESTGGQYSGILKSPGTTAQSGTRAEHDAFNYRQLNLLIVNLSEPSGHSIGTNTVLTGFMTSQAAIQDSYRPIVYMNSNPSITLGRITGVLSTTNSTTWVYQATFTTGSTASAYNAFEWNGTNPSMIQGSPGSLGVPVASNGSVNGGTCFVHPLGVTGWLSMYPDPNNAQWTFSAPNSAY